MTEHSHIANMDLEKSCLNIGWSALKSFESKKITLAHIHVNVPMISHAAAQRTGHLDSRFSSPDFLSLIIK